MANFNNGSGITFPSPLPLRFSTGTTFGSQPSVMMNQYAPNSTSSTNNIMFPAPPSLSTMHAGGRDDIMCTASNSRPAMSPCMASSWQSGFNHTIQWAPASIASPEMAMFNAAARRFNTNPWARPMSPIPSTSGTSPHFVIRVAKRKSDTVDLPSEVPKNKIHVNEETMSATMQELHLGNNNLDWHPDIEQQQRQLRNAQAWFQETNVPRTDSSNDINDDDINDDDINDDDINDDDINDEPSTSRNRDLDRVSLTNCASHSSSSSLSSEDCDSDCSSSTHSAGHRRQRSKSCPKIDFSPELQLSLKTKHILPKVILDELNKPCMQVMLWKPPGDVEDIMAGVHAAAQERIKNSEPRLSIQEVGGKEPEPSTSQTQPAVPNVWSLPVINNNNNNTTASDIEREIDRMEDDIDTMEL